MEPSHQNVPSTTSEGRGNRLGAARTRRSLAKIRGQVVVITGAAAGIGADLSRRLIANGASVALVDFDGGGAERLAGMLGPRALAFQADVTDPAQISEAIRAAAVRFGRIDVVVANAGIAGPSSPVTTVATADFERVVDINLLGVFHTVKAALPYLEQSSGYVLMTSSIAAVIGGPMVSGYMASKAGVEAFGRSLRIEARRVGVDVGIAYFGLVDTGLARELLHEGMGAVMASFPRMISQPIPVQSASLALAHGIARRSRRVTAPWWVGPLLDLRPFAILADRLLVLHPRLNQLIDQHGTVQTVAQKGAVDA